MAVVAAVAVAAALSACQLPCPPCANSGTCGGNSSYTSADGSDFGRCSCSGPWVGPRCDESADCSERCLNGAPCVAGQCACQNTSGWAGADCGEVDCGGDCGACTGYLCRVCTSDSQCTADRPKCSRSQVPVADGRAVCSVPSGDFLSAVGAAAARVYYRCWHSRWASDTPGDCRLEVHTGLGEPGGGEPFYCTSADCIIDTSAEPAVASPAGGGMKDAEWALTGVLVAALVCVVGASAIRRHIFVALSVLAAVIVIFILVAPSTAERSEPGVASEGQLTMTCRDATCACGRDAAGCGGPAISTALPFSDGWRLACSGQSCRLAINKLPFGDIPLSGCVFGECVASDAVFSSGDGGEDVLWSLLGIAVLAAGCVAAAAASSMRRSKALAYRWRVLHSDHAGADDKAGEEAGGLVCCADSPVMSPAERSRHSSQLSFSVSADGLSYSVSGRAVLSDVSLRVGTGHCVAVMGPSGAGKSTLLNLIARRKLPGTRKGQLSVTGVTAASVYLRSVRFAPDTPALLPALTARETVEFAAQLGLPCGVPAQVRFHRVTAILDALKLSGIADRTVGSGLSDGERKRLSVAVQLVCRPKVLLADEPTTGVDADTARILIHAMQKTEATIAESSTAAAAGEDTYARYWAVRPAVLLSIHQPSAELFAELDHLFVLSKRGKVIYNGPATDAAADLHRRYRVGDPADHANPGDYVAKVAAADDVDDVQPQEQQQPADGGFVSVAGPPRGWADADSVPTWPTQLRVLFHREIACVRNDPRLVGAHCFTACLFSVLIVVLYEAKDLTLQGVIARAGLLTFVLILLSLSSLSALDTFLSSRAVFMEERANQLYGPHVYFLVKAGFDVVVLRVIPAAVLSVVAYYSIGMRVDTGYKGLFKFVGVLALFNSVCAAACMCVSVAVPNQSTAALLGGVAMMWFFQFGGLVLQSGSSRAGTGEFLRWCSPFALAYEALMSAELEGQQCLFRPTDAVGRTGSVVTELRCEQYLSNLGLDPRNASADILVLVCWFAVYLIVAFVLVAVKLRVTE
eukprot:TRINITY_DN3055_c0_g2_i1.p1 TRINITY_DN3055_c0_g2~~TRINITY_DN3055_c0_g2_i1.p1  ORF type:complete len:1053 (+),score=243.61 TRINITY_DN3055_c0_g2_i1:62-3160(+)